jgi:hypothetical protein
MKLNSKILLSIVMFVLPIFCLALAIAGILVGYTVTTALSSDRQARSSLSGEEVEAEVLKIAADYAASGDLQIAQERLEALALPNSNQYISFMVDRYIQENRSPDDADTHNLFLLANALGTSTETMVAVRAEPASVALATLPPTNTPTLAALTAAVSAPEATPTFTITPIPPTDTPAPPTETPLPPTDTPTSAPPPPTSTPAPPTNTPEPTATPVPTKPPVDFVVAEAHMVPNPTYNSCPGAHQIFVTVVDVNGSPLDGVTVEDTFHAVPPHITGEKGPGKLEYDLWNNGFSLQITKNQDGSPAASEVTPKLSSWDEDIPDDWLVQANYCKDLADCAARKSSNQLCRGHYSYNVLFKRTY